MTEAGPAMVSSGHGGAVRVGQDSLGSRFETAPNALSLLRLCLAIEVVVWHSYALLGCTWLPGPVARIVGDVAVDSFFAISGFLVCRSWHRRPGITAFASARVRRIAPGLWVCLLLTAFAIAPAAAVAGGSTAPTFAQELRYVVGNLGGWVTQLGMAGTPSGVPYPGVWNGSLWSLGYEVACYSGLAALGICGLLRARVVTGVAVLAWMTCVVAVLVGAPLSGGTGVVPLTVRTVLMFSCGAVLHLRGDRVPFSSLLAVGSLVLLLLGATTPDYRVLAAPGLAYLCIYGSLVVGRSPRLRLRNDLSYGTYVYGFPLQQALLMSGVRPPWLVFTALSIALTVAMAALSWRFVERPALAGRSSADRLATAPAGMRTDLFTATS